MEISIDVSEDEEEKMNLSQYCKSRTKIARLTRTSLLPLPISTTSQSSKFPRPVQQGCKPNHLSCHGSPSLSVYKIINHFMRAMSPILASIQRTPKIHNASSFSYLSNEFNLTDERLPASSRLPYLLHQANGLPHLKHAALFNTFES